MSYRFKFRRGPASEWTADNPVLLAGEPGLEIDTYKLKIGDGVQLWNDLEYFPNIDDLIAGVASVDGRIGVVTLTDLYAAIAHAHTQSDVTGLTAALSGKAATSHTHIENDVTGLISDLAGKASSVHAHSQSDVTGLSTSLSGKSDTGHAHAESDVTGLASSLDGKSDTSHTHAPESTLTIARKKTSSGNFLGSDTSGLYVVCNNGTEDLAVSIPAVVGDYLEVSLSALVTQGTLKLEYVVVKSGVIVEYGSTNTGSPAFEGDPSLYNDAGFIITSNGASFIVTTPMLDSGEVTVGLARFGSDSTGRIYSDTNYPSRLTVKNYGQVDIV